MRSYNGIGSTLLFHAALLAGCGGSDGETAATAGDFRTSVEEVAQLLAPISALPNEPGVVETTLEFWTDYTLLAHAVNTEGGVEGLDLEVLTNLERSRQLVVRLRDEVIQVDTVIDDDELREAFELGRPSEEVRARHILISVPPGATAAQVDSLRSLAEGLRERALAGEDFAALAQENSQDPGSAVQGGDLGFFGRGLMVPPFEEAAFALSPGETSDVVRTDFGFHVIRLEETRSPSLAEVADEFRQQVQVQRIVVAESIYLAQIDGPANVQVVDGAIQLSREIAEDPEAELTGANQSALLTSYVGGEYTAAEYRTFLSSQPATLWEQIAVAPDEQLEQMLRELTRDQILLVEAADMGIALTPEEEVAVATQVREQYGLIAGFLGLDSLAGSTEAETTEAIEQEIDALMSRLVTNEQDIVPLGPLARPLRERYGARVTDDAVVRVVARVGELRSAGIPAAAPTAPPATTAPPNPPAEAPPAGATEPEP